MCMYPPTADCSQCPSSSDPEAVEWKVATFTCLFPRSFLTWVGSSCAYTRITKAQDVLVMTLLAQPVMHVWEKPKEQKGSRVCKSVQMCTSTHPMSHINELKGDGANTSAFLSFLAYSIPMPVQSRLLTKSMRTK